MTMPKDQACAGHQMQGFHANPGQFTTNSRKVQVGIYGSNTSSNSPGLPIQNIYRLGDLQQENTLPTPPSNWVASLCGQETANCLDNYGVDVDTRLDGDSS
ncbi:uncharacterized protein [Periplaneta americana]|uniref:uncharacterized protein n=1 Tax=Periplaneta americana TaxID=6978 RepID=UPI0037E93C11